VNTPRSSCKTMRTGVVKTENERDPHALKKRRKKNLFVVCSLFLPWSWSFWFTDPHVGSHLTEEQNAQSRNRDAH
jgi:hypothetical protein